MSNSTWNNEEELEAQALKELAMVYESPAEIKVLLSPRSIYMLITVIQVAARHPNALSNPTFQDAVNIAQQLAPVFDDLPAVAAIIRRGWHRDFDVEPE